MSAWNTARLRRGPWSATSNSPSPVCGSTFIGLGRTFEITSSTTTRSKRDQRRNTDVDLSKDPPLGLAHFTVLEVPPLDLVLLAADIGYADIGLRLHPAFPGSPFYEVPAGSAVSREMQRRM